MTEHEWQNASEPQAMLEFLRQTGSMCPRKARLFAVACSRRIWALIDPLGRAAVDMAESFADGRAGPEELRAARLACQGAGGQAAWYAAATNPAIAARNAARSAQAGVGQNAGAEVAELVAQAALVRDLFGLPFRYVSIESSWLSSAVIEIANDIYRADAFHRMPELADALHEVGCDNEEVLSHCQAAGLHVRGCYVVDLIRDGPIVTEDCTHVFR